MISKTDTPVNSADEKGKRAEFFSYVESLSESTFQRRSGCRKVLTLAIRIGLSRLDAYQCVTHMGLFGKNGRTNNRRGRKLFRRLWREAEASLPKRTPSQAAAVDDFFTFSTQCVPGPAIPPQAVISVQTLYATDCGIDFEDVLAVMKVTRDPEERGSWWTDQVRLSFEQAKRNLSRYASLARAANGSEDASKPAAERLVDGVKKLKGQKRLKLKPDAKLALCYTAILTGIDRETVWELKNRTWKDNRLAFLRAWYGTFAFVFNVPLSRLPILKAILCGQNAGKAFQDFGERLFDGDWFEFAKRYQDELDRLIDAKFLLPPKNQVECTECGKPNCAFFMCACLSFSNENEQGDRKNWDIRATLASFAPKGRCEHGKTLALRHTDNPHAHRMAYAACRCWSCEACIDRLRWHWGHHAAKLILGELVLSDSLQPLCAGQLYLWKGQASALPALRKEIARKDGKFLCVKPGESAMVVTTAPVKHGVPVSNTDALKTVLEAISSLPVGVSRPISASHAWKRIELKTGEWELHSVSPEKVDLRLVQNQLQQLGARFEEKDIPSKSGGIEDQATFVFPNDWTVPEMDAAISDVMAGLAPKAPKRDAGGKPCPPEKDWWSDFDLVPTREERDRQRDRERQAAA